MLFPTLVVALQAAPDPAVYHGRQGALTVRPPRIEAHAVIDGALDEGEWQRAALLTGFSQYLPVDGLPAEDSTEVLVWYAPDGMYFGIRAFESHGVVNATLADRDKITTDDYVQLLLDTFDDRRRAFVLGVNPLGVQADGIRSEGTMGAAGGPGAGGRFEDVDMNPDFVFESRGTVTDFGYQVEIFVPFKSLRFQSADPQRWAINVIRKVQHSGYENTWTPVRRAGASFLAQSGSLEGLTGLRRGLVMDVNPFATGRLMGAPDGAGGWTYDATPEIGANVRWGATTNLTLDATANPDFSQVEADVGQVTVNERFDVFFPEKRPFFLEGIEQFDTPNQLIYMRRIRNPLGGAKLAGKVGRLNVGLLTALDGRPYSASGDDYPSYTLLRLRQDVGSNSTVGLAYTGKLDGGDLNQVAAADVHLVFARLYYFEAQVAGSVTESGGDTRTAPLWTATVDRTGRSWGFRYSVTGIHRDFQAQSGFLPRTGVVETLAANRLTTYGAPGSMMENWTTFFTFEGVWDYDGFLDAAAPRETSVQARSFFTLRGSWRPSVTPRWLTAAFDPAFYAGYYVAAAGDTVPFTVPDRVNDALGVTLGLTTPEFPTLSADASVSLGKDIAYYEPARANARSLSATVAWRPTSQLRIEARYTHAQLDRERDGSRLSTANIPRLKIEYQLARPVFVRFVGQYVAQERDALRDPATDQPILLRDAGTAAFTPSQRTVQNDLRMDLLFSYRPTPGTVVFLGYGASYTEDDAFRFSDVARVNDGFFAKVSYLFRL
jgi:hypothetical protein